MGSGMSSSAPEAGATPRDRHGNRHRRPSVRIKKVFEPSDMAIRVPGDYEYCWTPGWICATSRDHVLVYSQQSRSTAQYQVKSSKAAMQPYGSLLVWESSGFFTKKWQVLDTQTGREKHDISISRLIPGDCYWWWLDPSTIAIRRQRTIHTLAITDPTAKPVKILDLDPSFEVDKSFVSSNAKRSVWLCSGVVSRSADRSRAWYLHFPGLEKEERLAAEYCALELVTCQGHPIDVLFTARGVKDRILLKMYALDEADREVKFRTVDVSFRGGSKTDKPHYLKVDDSLGILFLLLESGRISVHSIFNGVQLQYCGAPSKVFSNRKWLATTTLRSNEDGPIFETSSHAHCQLFMDEAELAPWNLREGAIGVPEKTGRKVQEKGKEKEIVTLVTTQPPPYSR